MATNRNSAEGWDMTKENELTKLRIKYERLERERIKLKKIIDAQIETLRHQYSSFDYEVVKAYNEYREKGLELGYCTVCKKSLNECEGHVLLASTDEAIGNRVFRNDEDLLGFFLAKETV